MTTIVYGHEVIDDNNINDLENTDPTTTLQEIDTVYSHLQASLECLNTLYDIYNHTKDRVSTESISDNEKALIQVTLDSITTRLGLESTEYKPDTFTKIIDRIYLIVLSLLDIIFEFISRFLKWSKEQFDTSGKKALKINNAIRYLYVNSPKDTFELVIPVKEIEYFYIKDKGFSIEETIALFTSLISIYTKSTTLTENVNNALYYRYGDKKVINIKFDAIFPVLAEKRLNKVDVLDGPELPRKYRLSAAFPHNRNLDPNDLEWINTLGVCDFSITKHDYRDPFDKSKDHVVTLSKDELMELANTQTMFIRQGANTNSYTDMLLGMIARLRRHYRNLNYKGSSNFDTESNKYLNINLNIIQFILRSIKNPFFKINNLAHETETVLLNRLIKFTEKELKEIKK